jgi:penicillin-binding protein-related factor A (putative recombinase)
LTIAKIEAKKTAKTFNYATIEDLIEQLHFLEKQMGWPIFGILIILKQKKADTFSITKEKPFYYFYARLSDKNITIIFQTSEQETEFRLPIEYVGEK